MQRLPNYCRMCISRDDERRFIPLIGRNQHLKQKFEFCFSIPLHPADFHVLCPRCADKLTEVAMVHMMVKDSNAFFNRLPPGSQDYSSNSNYGHQDYNSFKPNRNSYPDAISRFTNSYQNSSLDFCSDDVSQLSRQSAQNFSQVREPGPSGYSGSQYPSDHYTDNNNDAVEILTTDDEDTDEEEKKNSFSRCGQRVYPCQVCEKEFSRAKFRRMHYTKIHPNLTQYTCPECNEKFTFKSCFKLHVNLFNHMSCKNCHMRFKNYNQMKIHKKRCSGFRLFGCPHCPKKFKSENGRKNHCDSVHFKR